MSVDPLKQAIDLSKAGRGEEARELLVRLIEADVHNEPAWLWYSYTLPNRADRIRALEECLFYNPRCEAAQSGLVTLKEDYPQTADSGIEPPSSMPKPRRSLLLGGGAVGLVVLCVVCGVVSFARLPRGSSPPAPVKPSAEISMDTAVNVVLALEVEANAPGEVTWSPDGHTLAVADYEGIHLYDANILSETLLLGTGGVNTVAFSPDGQTAASDWQDNKVRLWRLPEGHPIDTMQCRPGMGGAAIMAQVVHVEFSPDSTLLAAARLDNCICLWRTDGQLLYTLEHPDFVAKTAFSPDGAVLASSGGDRIVRLWHVDRGELLAELRGHRDHVYSIAFSPDGSILASGSDDGTIRLWRTENRTLFRTLAFDRRGCTGLDFSPDGQILASSFTNITLWSVSDGRLLKVLRGGDEGFVMSVGFSPDGRLLASGSGSDSAGGTRGFIRLWAVP